MSNKNPPTNGFNKNPQNIKKNPPGRVGGFSYWSAKLFADMLESETSAKDKTPFAITALKKYKESVVKLPMMQKDFMDRLGTSDMIEKLDDLLANQATRDIDFVRWQIRKDLHDKQRIILDTTSPMVLVITGRRFGKTEADAALAVDSAISDVGNVLYVGLTFSSAMKQMWGPIEKRLKKYSIGFVPHQSDGYFEITATGNKIYIQGASSRPDFEKIRGDKYRVVIIDEAQSQRWLYPLLNEVIKPTTADYGNKTKLVLSGTSPKTGKTHFEELWNAPDNNSTIRITGTMNDNPFMPNFPHALEDEMKKYGYDESDPAWQREYLGVVGLYDETALVYHLNEEKGFYEDEELYDFIKKHNVTDLYVSGGVDFGFRDSDAACLILGSKLKNDPTKFLIWEYKRNEEGQKEYAEALQRGIELVASLNLPLFTTDQAGRRSYKFFYYHDTNELRTAEDFKRVYGLPMMPALKQDKDFAIGLLQEEVRQGHLKIKRGSYLEEEMRSTLWKRDEKDPRIITREIDDEVFHPDSIDAVLYASRQMWNLKRGK